MISMPRNTVIALAACLLIVLRPVSAPALDSGEAKEVALNGDGNAGEAIYLEHCASCHGIRGAGDGPQGRAFDPRPADFTAIEADAERFYLATRDGGMAIGMSGAMPMYRHTLDDGEIRDVVAHLMHLRQRSSRPGHQ